MWRTDQWRANTARAELDQRARERRLQLESLEWQLVAELRPVRRSRMALLYWFGSPICGRGEMADGRGQGRVSGAQRPAFDNLVRGLAVAT